MQQQAASKPHMKYLGDGAYWVESRRFPGEGYKVTADHCSCAAASYGRSCWHIKLVQQAVHWTEQTQRATTAAPFHESAGYQALAACFG
jgi:hypothetical protein